MKNKLIILSLLLVIASVLAACSASVTTTTTVPGMTLESQEGAQSTSGGPAETSGIYRKISAEDARDWLAKDDSVLLLDVRTKEEFDASRIPGSKLMPYNEITDRLDELPADLQTPVIVYCRSGSRSATAARTLLELGYTEVYDLGGIMTWPYETVQG